LRVGDQRVFEESIAETGPVKHIATSKRFRT
jgi:hypothetical protein